MTQTFELLNSVFSLEVRVISGPNSPHRGRLITSVALSGVLKIRVRTTWAINANITSHSNMGASVGLTHDCNHCNTTSSSDWLTLEIRREFSLMTFW